MTETLTPQEILALPLGSGNRTSAKTVGQYFTLLVNSFFAQGDSLSGKAPFGDSDWESPLILAFADAKLMWLRTDEYSQIDDYSTAEFSKIIDELIDFLFNADYMTMDLVLPPPPPKEWYLVCVEKDLTGPAYLTDYFGDSYTEEEAKTKALRENEPFDQPVWFPVHIPSVS